MDKTERAIFDEVFDVLVKQAGVPETQRDNFISVLDVTPSWKDATIRFPNVMGGVTLAFSRSTSMGMRAILPPGTENPERVDKLHDINTALRTLQRRWMNHLDN